MWDEASPVSVPVPITFDPASVRFSDFSENTEIYGSNVEKQTVVVIISVRFQPYLAGIPTLHALLIMDE